MAPGQPRPSCRAWSARQGPHARRECDGHGGAQRRRLILGKAQFGSGRASTAGVPTRSRHSTGRGDGTLDLSGAEE